MACNAAAYRAWGSAPYNQGDAFDFSWIFETDGYVQRRRKFINAISTDSSGNSLGDYVEVSYDSGSTWQEHTEDFDVLDGQCGIWLSSDEFSDSVWNAAVAGTLRFRITAAVESDERLSCVVVDGPVNSVAEVVDHVIDKSSQFKFRKVSGKSVFHNSTADGIGVADEVDDTEALMGYVRRIAGSSLNIIETIEVQTPMIAMAYKVGDRVVSGPQSRDILGIRLDGRSVFWIDRAVMDFQKQCMYLKVLRRRG